MRTWKLGKQPVPRSLFRKKTNFPSRDLKKTAGFGNDFTTGRPSRDAPFLFPGAPPRMTAYEVSAPGILPDSVNDG